MNGILKLNYWHFLLVIVTTIDCKMYERRFIFHLSLIKNWNYYIVSYKQSSSKKVIPNVHFFFTKNVESFFNSISGKHQ